MKTYIARTHARLLRLLLLVCFGLAVAVQPVEAQIWDKIKERVKEETEERVDENVDEAVEKGADEAEKELEASLKSALDDMGEKAAPPSLRPNATQPADAPQIQYQSITEIALPGLGAMSKLAGAKGTSETITLRQNQRRSDQDGQSTIIDLERERYVTLDHEKKQYRIVTFEDLAQQLKEPASNTQQNDQSSAYEFDVRVERLDQQKEINGTLAEPMVFVLETKHKGSGDAEAQDRRIRGTFYVVSEMWMTDQVAGHQTMQAFNRQMSEATGAQFQQQDWSGMLSAALSDPRLETSLREAAAQMKEIEGLPVRTTMHVVLGPENKDLDVARVMRDESEASGSGLAALAAAGGGGEQVTEQATLLRLTTHVSGLQAVPADDSAFEVPDDYEQVDQF